MQVSNNKSTFDEVCTSLLSSGRLKQAATLAANWRRLVNLVTDVLRVLAVVMSEPPSECTVLIIGAGLAGLQTLKSLKQQGVEGVAPWALNVGPEFIHGEINSPVVDLVREAGFKTKEYEWPDKYFFGKDKRWEDGDTKDADVERVHELFENMKDVELPEVGPLYIPGPHPGLVGWLVG
eukprot:624682-Prorocentrum_minimum.AAC.4